MHDVYEVEASYIYNTMYQRKVLSVGSRLLYCCDSSNNSSPQLTGKQAVSV